MKKYSNVDEYLDDYSGETRMKLDQIRQTIKDVAPEATEKISYGIPTFELNHRNLVHFACYKGHIGFYPGSAPVREFVDELKHYKTSKGTIQFPLGKPLPLDLICKITEVCLQRNLEKKKK